MEKSDDELVKEYEERAINFSKLEKERFQKLIEKYKETLFCKKTDNQNIIMKNKIWAAIHAEFNAVGEHPRTLRQLKAKFDNMKRNARKDASQERQARFRTGGGPPAPPVQQDTEWFRSVMPVSMDGLPSVVDDDFIQIDREEVIESEVPPVHPSSSSAEIGDILAEADKENIILVPDTEVFNSKSPGSLLRRPVSRPLRTRKKCNGLGDSKKFYELRTEVLINAKEQEKHLYEVKLMHMQEKRKEEKELHELKKEKLKLEIDLLQKNK